MSIELGRLPAGIAAVLERRYLAGFDQQAWRVQPADRDLTVPILREVTALGRPLDANYFARAMPYVLAALHHPGHDLIMVLHGDGRRHRLYFGLRRRIGGGSSENAMEGLSGAFRAQIPGLEFGGAAPLSPAGHQALSSFLEVAPYLGTMTGIPSARGGPFPTSQQSIDRLPAAIGNRAYLLLVVAEPILVGKVEASMATCRHLLEEIHSQIHTTISRSRSGSRSTSEQATLPQKNSGIVMGPIPQILRVLSYARCIEPRIAMVGDAGLALLRSVDKPEGTPSRTITHGETASYSDTSQFLDADARYCQSLLERHHQRLTNARGTGWWRTAVSIAADDEATLSSVTQILRSIAAGDATELEPLRTQRPHTQSMRTAMQHGRILEMRSLSPSPAHPLGAEYDALATCITSEELAVLIHPPQANIH